MENIVHYYILRAISEETSLSHVTQKLKTKTKTKQK